MATKGGKIAAVLVWTAVLVALYLLVCSKARASGGGAEPTPSTAFGAIFARQERAGEEQDERGYTWPEPRHVPRKEDHQCAALIAFAAEVEANRSNLIEACRTDEASVRHALPCERRVLIAREAIPRTFAAAVALAEARSPNRRDPPLRAGGLDALDCITLLVMVTTIVLLARQVLKVTRQLKRSSLRVQELEMDCKVAQEALEEIQAKTRRDKAKGLAQKVLAQLNIVLHPASPHKKDVRACERALEHAAAHCPLSFDSESKSVAGAGVGAGVGLGVAAAAATVVPASIDEEARAIVAVSVNRSPIDVFVGALCAKQETGDASGVCPAFVLRLDSQLPNRADVDLDDRGRGAGAGAYDWSKLAQSLNLVASVARATGVRLHLSCRSAQQLECATQSLTTLAQIHRLTPRHSIHIWLSGRKREPLPYGDETHPAKTDVRVSLERALSVADWSAILSPLVTSPLTHSDPAALESSVQNQDAQADMEVDDDDDDDEYDAPYEPSGADLDEDDEDEEEDEATDDDDDDDDAVAVAENISVQQDSPPIAVLASPQTSTSTDSKRSKPVRSEPEALSSARAGLASSSSFASSSASPSASSISSSSGSSSSVGSTSSVPAAAVPASAQPMVRPILHSSSLHNA